MSDPTRTCRVRPTTAPTAVCDRRSNDRAPRARPEHGAATATLAQNHITPVASSLYLDLDALLLSLDPQARFFSHDKIEGVAALNGGTEIVISNDSDFGIAGRHRTGPSQSSPPWTLVPKISPATGKQDDGEYLSIDTERVDPTTGAAKTSTATVTINVTGS